MNKLKKLSQEDLDDISDFLSKISNDFILKNVKSKEIINMDIDINLAYDDELDVDISIDLEFDKFSKAKPEIANEAIDYSLSKLDSFLNENYREE